jgi:hypothetical protein
MSGETTINRIASEERLVTQVLLSSRTVAAAAAGFGKPRDTYTISYGKIADPRPEFLNSSDDFMARNDRQLWLRQFTIHDVQVSTTHAARRDTHPDLAFAGFGKRKPTCLKVTTRTVQNHGTHQFSSRVRH